MIFPLLDMMEGGKTKEGLLLLGKKATEMFQSLYKVKKVGSSLLHSGYCTIEKAFFFQQIDPTNLNH